jgi:hypothetical protein
MLSSNRKSMATRRAVRRIESLDGVALKSMATRRSTGLDEPSKRVAMKI